MSETGDSPHPDLPQLEPWALELEESDSGGSDPQTREELARVIARLRALPDPELPPGLGEGVLERIRAEAERPRLLRPLFGIRAAGAGLALAAGVAGLLALAVAPEPLAGWFGAEETSRPLAIRIPDHIRYQSTPVAVAGSRRDASGVGRFGARPVLVSQGGVRPVAAFAGAGPPRGAWQRNMDRQLNRLQLDPDAFAQRLERTARRDALISLLARRAGERGDAPEIAMRVRRSAHPLAEQISQRMLRAALVQGSSRH